MSYLYHQLWKDMRGTVLYPLNQLSEVYPDLYAARVEKYTGREYMLEQIIPGLNCKWNDVLFFSPVHPEEISKAYREIGESFAGRHYVQVPADSLDPQKSLIFRYQHRRKEDDMKEENFEPYDPEKLAGMAQLPQETKEYYKQKFAAGEKPLLWHRVPHVLYLGSIDIATMSVIVTD